MTPATLVHTLRARGVHLEPFGDKLRVVPSDAVTPEEVEALRLYKAEVLALLAAPPPGVCASAPGSPALSRTDHESAYHATITRALELIALGPDARDCEAVYAEEARLVSELGPRRATAIRREVAREWYRQHNTCPLCGEPGVFHPEGGDG